MPKGFRVATFEAGGAELAVVSYDLGSVELGRLTAVEREVAALLLAGRSRSAIAMARGRSKATIARQVESIYKKLGVRSRAELVSLLTRPAPGREG